MDALLSIIKIAAALFFIGCAVSLLFVAGSLAIVKTRQGQAAIIERGGKLARVATPGISFKIPGLEEVVGTVDCQQIRIHETLVAAKTREGANINIPATIRYRAHAERADVAFYVPEDIIRQIDYIAARNLQGCARAYSLADSLVASSELAVSLANELEAGLLELGYEFIDAYIGIITAAAEVESIINQIPALPYESQLAVGRMEIEGYVELARIRNQAEATAILAEAERLIQLQLAETNVRVSQLTGQGLAAQQQAIAEGFTLAIAAFQKFESREVRELLARMFREYFVYEAMKRANLIISNLDPWPKDN